MPADPARLGPEPLPAGVAVLNGAGEMTGSLQVAEWGRLQTPIYLTATMSVGRVYDGAVAAAVAADHAVGVESVVIPVVPECDDSWLNDARVVQVEAADAGRALDAAAPGGPVEQGAVGAGTGMTCFDWKGGIGTSSRRCGEWTVGVLVLANFGSREQLRVDGVPVGRVLDEPEARRRRRLPGAASRWWRPMRRSPRPTSPGWPAVPAWAWPAPDRWRTTAAARSSSRSRRTTGRSAPPGTSTSCSRRRWRRPRSRC